MVALNNSIREALLDAIQRLDVLRMQDIVDGFLSRVLQEGVSMDVTKLCGNVTSQLVIFAIGNGGAAKASDEELIALLQQGEVNDQFIATSPQLQQCYLLEHGALKVLLIIRPLR